MTTLVEPTPAPAADGATPASEERTGKPLTSGKQRRSMIIALWAFVLIPFAAVLAAVPVAWGWGMSWLDVAMALVFYCVGGIGIGTGFHRHLTHGSFKAKRWLRIALTVAGCTAIEGEPTQWVADHRRHHAYSDREGDPHSPWRYGESFWGLTKGLFFAHVGWLFFRDLSNPNRFAPDLVADKDIARIGRLFPWIVTASVVLPAIIGGLVTWSWQGALSGLFWAGLVRIAVLHHVTWSVNSICHVYGERPFETREGDRASNFWPLAVLSFGESWHNLHHADPTCARHGVDKGQIDINAGTIRIFEKLGWVSDVRWPKPERLATKRLADAGTMTT
jgi:stearoyl-CoA desaturase (delta-9 desaturase)